VRAAGGVRVAGNTIQHPADQYVGWDMMNRHSRYTPLAVFRDRDAFLYALPFVDNDYVDFMISVPLRFRADQYLYKKMLLTTYPDLYALPTKNTQGMPITSNGPAVVLRRVSKVAKTAVNNLSSAMIRKTLFLNPGLNYLDYDDLLRTNHEYRDFVHRMIGRLQQRDLFDNRYLTGLWILHMLGFRNSATLFGLLVTYEMFLEEFADEPGSAGSTQSDPATG
jgi:asparagine synthase (glutamine-hydrolysing)